MAVPDEDYHREISEALAGCLKELTGENRDRSVLVAGLGNRDVTPDALGPKTVSNLMITRHLFREYGKETMGMEQASARQRNCARGDGPDWNGDVRNSAGDH